MINLSLSVMMVMTPTLGTEDVNEIASIVAGETIPGVDQAHMWVACTILDDLERGYTVAGLHPGRWNGHRPPAETHIAAVQRSLNAGCTHVPECRFLGSGKDHDRHWSHLPNRVHRIRSGQWEMVCVERENTTRITTRRRESRHWPQWKLDALKYP